MRAYILGKHGDDALIRRVDAALRSRDDIHFVSTEMTGVRNEVDAMHAFQLTITAVNAADTMILVFSEERPNQAMVGYAYAIGVPVVAITDQDTKEFSELSPFVSFWLRFDQVANDKDFAGIVIQACLLAADMDDGDTKGINA